MCGKWGGHYRAGHLTGEDEKEGEADDGDGHVAIVKENSEDIPPPSGAFARLHAAGLI